MGLGNFNPGCTCCEDSTGPVCTIHLDNFNPDDFPPDDSGVRYLDAGGSWSEILNDWIVEGGGIVRAEAVADVALAVSGIKHPNASLTPLFHVSVIIHDLEENYEACVVFDKLNNTDSNDYHYVCTKWTSGMSEDTLHLIIGEMRDGVDTVLLSETLPLGDAIVNDNIILDGGNYSDGRVWGRVIASTPTSIRDLSRSVQSRGFFDGRHHGMRAYIPDDGEVHFSQYKANISGDDAYAEDNGISGCLHPFKGDGPFACDFIEGFVQSETECLEHWDGATGSYTCGGGGNPNPEGTIAGSGIITSQVEYPFASASRKATSVEVEFETPSVPATVRAITDYVDDNNYHWAEVTIDEPGELKVGKVDGGVESTLHTEATTGYGSVNTRYYLRLGITDETDDSSYLLGNLFDAGDLVTLEPGFIANTNTDSHGGEYSGLNGGGTAYIYDFRATVGVSVSGTSCFSLLAECTECDGGYGAESYLVEITNSTGPLAGLDGSYIISRCKNDFFHGPICMWEFNFYADDDNFPRIILGFSSTTKILHLYPAGSGVVRQFTPPDDLCLDWDDTQFAGFFADIHLTAIRNA